MGIIETKGLTKYYGGVTGIKDLSLKVFEGEIPGFIGPNGAGKSTTIRLLLSLIYPSSGSATIFGKDVIEYGPEIKREIGYMPSEVFCYENMRVKDLLDYSASFYHKDCSRRIADISALLKLELNKKIDDLSYGNKKGGDCPGPAPRPAVDHSRRADRRPGPVDPEELLPVTAGRKPGRQDHLLFLPHSERSPEDL